MLKLNPDTVLNVINIFWI